MDLPAKQSNFKNVTLRIYDKAGVESYKLLGECGEVQAFSMFIATLERQFSPNTVKAYARGLANFFNYFYEAGCHIAAKEGRCEVFRSELKEIIESWDDYLKIGEHSNLPLVQAVCKTLPSPYVGTSTSTQYHAALKNFLSLSERFRSEGDELSRYGFVQKIYDADVLYEDMGR